MVSFPILRFSSEQPIQWNVEKTKLNHQKSYNHSDDGRESQNQIILRLSFIWLRARAWHISESVQFSLFCLFLIKTSKPCSTNNN